MRCLWGFEVVLVRIDVVSEGLADIRLQTYYQCYTNYDNGL